MKKVFFCLLSVLLIVSCEITKSNKQIQSDKAQKAAESINYTENAEIENIKERLNLTSQPGLIGYVLLLNEAGQPIFYTTIKGKITSGSKRLTKPFKPSWEGRYYPTPSDEGTWGSSSPYIYFWSTTGQYYQWNGKYLYSDKPFRLTVKPLVVSIKPEK